MRVAIATVGAFVLAFFVGTAVAGRGDAVERDVRVRARVWCESLVARDAFRYQETFRRGYFRGTFDRGANTYREPTEAQILADMPRTSVCAVGSTMRGPDDRGEVYMPVIVDGQRRELRMRREGGFWVVWQL